MIVTVKELSKVKAFLKQNSIFLSLSLILIVVLGLALLYIPKGELHLLLCDRHTPAGDIFYKYYTQIAEWFPYFVCVGLLVFGKLGDGMFATSAMIFSALTTQIFKNIVNAPRPYKWFQLNMPEVQLPSVEGVEFHSWFSFPSGHTTSFFALTFVICILLTRRPRDPRYPRTTSAIIQIGLFIAATLGAYSRIYLSQHFALDVFAGIIVGVLVTMICYAIFSRYRDKKWYNYRVFQKK